MPSQPKNTKHKVLVYLFGSLGDTIVAIPALRAVRRHFADAEIVLLQNSQSDAIVLASEVLPDGLIDRFIGYKSSFDSNKVSTFIDLWQRVRKEDFDAAVYLVLSERPAKSVRRDKYFFRSCGIRVLKGFHAFSSDELYPVDSSGRPSMTPHEALRKLERLQKDGIDSTEDDLLIPFFTFSDLERDNIKGWLKPLRNKPNSRLIAIAPGCKTKSNQWPIENFIELGRDIVAAEDCELIVVGGKAEFDLGEKILTEIGEGINAAGKFGVRDSAVLLSLCDLYIGLDTGTTHLAYAVGIPTLGIYGERNNPGQWFPLGEKNTVVSRPVPCSGCRLFECPISEHPCMTGISTETVISKFREFIGQMKDTENVMSGQYHLR